MKIPLIENKVIAVWFSCGAASAVAAKRTIDLYGGNNEIRIINNPIKEEDEDNTRFLLDVQDWLGVEIETATNPKYPNASIVEVFNTRKYMSGVSGAPCTLELKKNARYEWEKRNHADYHVLGFTLEEKQRHENFIKSERDLLPVLIAEGISKGDCFNILTVAGIKLPRIYTQGYPNANCIGCVKATSPTYWNHVRKMHPEVFAERAIQSEEIGAKLVRVKGERILLSQLDPKATGRPMRDMDFECGIFCEELI